MAEWLTERARNGGIDEVPVDGVAGRLWLCGKHLVGPDPDGALGRTGAAMIVCLNEIGELASRYPDYVDWLRANAGGRALWWPVHDMHAPAVDDLRELVGAIRTRLAAGDGVIVHCGAGIGRAGTVAAAVLVAGGAGVNEALTIVRTARPTAGPQTIEQERLLTEFAAALG